MSKDFKDVETIIGSTVKVEGDFKGQGDVVVEGQVVGSLTTKQTLTVGENAKIKANVEAANAFVAGEIVGNLKINDSLELAGTAKIRGDIETKIITIATGAVVNGNIKMEKEELTGEKEKKEK